MYQFKFRRLIRIFCSHFNFNTSHVSVQGRDKKISFEIIHISIHLMYQFKFFALFRYSTSFYFNTSHVSVQVLFTSQLTTSRLFQYISCISSRNFLSWSCLSWNISIHLMYQFKSFKRFLIQFGLGISIHLMYQFKI